MSEPVAALREFLDDRLGDSRPIEVEAMVGGGSCEIFAVQRGSERWVLRRAPSHASSATAHDVLREFRILDAIKDEAVTIARPVLACDDPAVFGAPFYVMARIDGVPVRSRDPAGVDGDAGAATAGARPARRRARRDPRGRLGTLRSRRAGPPRTVPRTADRSLAVAARVLRRTSAARGHATSPSGWPTPARTTRPAALAHGDYKLDNVLFAESAPPDLLAVVDWEMASIGDPLIDLAWAMIFHPGPEGTMPLGVAADPRSTARVCRRARR